MGAWRKSTYSGANGGSCIEVSNTPAKVLVRDTKQEGRRDRTTLAVAPVAWRAFVGKLK